MAREYIRLVSGKQVGWVDSDSAGNKIVYNNTGRIVSKYIKSTNVTTDHLGKVLVFGDVASGLLFIKDKTLTETMEIIKNELSVRKPVKRKQS